MRTERRRVALIGLVAVLTLALAGWPVVVLARGRSHTAVHVSRVARTAHVRVSAHSFRSARTTRPVISSKYYKSSGLPKHRSESAKRRFLRSQGLKKVPSGYQVDHIVPLAAGGSDTPSNMELIPTATHRAKTAREAKVYRWHKKR